MGLIEYGLLILSALWLTFNLFQLRDLMHGYEIKQLGPAVVIGWTFAVPVGLVLLVLFRVGI